MPYYERRIYAGPMLEVKRYMGTQGGRPLGSRKKDDSKSRDELNDVQSWRKLWRLLACNFSKANGDLCLTLKFEKWVAREEAHKQYERFLKQLRYIRKKRGMEELKYLIPVVKSLRESGVACEIYPEQSKLKKQFDYADKKAIPFLSIVGGNEVEAGIVNLKNLTTGEQQSFAKDDLEGMLSFIC